MKRELAAILFLAISVSCTAQDSPLAWLNDSREAAGAHSVEADALLSAVAQRWAVTLAEAGVLSHRGADGTTVLDRYRATGGTEAHVGEILGAGPTLADVENGWARSADHRQMMLGRGWTHAGWGSAPRGSSQVWVVVFCEKLVANLSILDAGEGLTVRGRFTASGATAGLLYSGLAAIPPAAWDDGTRGFSFEVPSTLREGYVRLGYIDPTGIFMLTNAFTLPRGTGSPGAPARFSPPAPSP